MKDTNYVKPQALDDFQDTTTEEFPYLATVLGIWKCPGIFITENYLIVQAACVEGRQSVSVHLGLTKWSWFSNKANNDSQIFISTDITIHEEYNSLGEDGHYLNNIALIKLPKSIMLSRKVLPAKLISKKETFGQVLVASGWGLMYSKMRTNTLQLLNQDTCSYIFGTTFLRNQELCAKTTSKIHLFKGNAVQWNDKLIGFITKRHKCVINETSCEKIHVIFNLIPFIDWISLKTNVSVTELSGESEEKCGHAALKKAEYLENIVNLIKIQYERDITKLNQNLSNISVQLQTSENKQTNNNVDFEKELKEIRADITSCKNKENQQISKQQEEINDLKAAITNIISMQDDRNKIQTNLEKQVEEILLVAKEIEFVKENVYKIEAKHEQDTVSTNENIKIIMKELMQLKVEQLSYSTQLHKQFEQIHLLSKQIQFVNGTVNTIKEYIDGPIIN